jgi:hypothetical protein
MKAPACAAAPVAPDPSFGLGGAARIQTGRTYLHGPKARRATLILAPLNGPVRTAAVIVPGRR